MVTDRQTYRQRVRQTDGQTDRQTNRQYKNRPTTKDRKPHTHSHCCSIVLKQSFQPLRANYYQTMRTAGEEHTATYPQVTTSGSNKTLHLGHPTEQLRQHQQLQQDGRLVSRVRRAGCHNTQVGCHVSGFGPLSPEIELSLRSDLIRLGKSPDLHSSYYMSCWFIMVYQ